MKWIYAKDMKPEVGEPIVFQTKFANTDQIDTMIGRVDRDGDIRSGTVDARAPKFLFTGWELSSIWRWIPLRDFLGMNDGAES